MFSKKYLPALLRAQGRYSSRLPFYQAAYQQRGFSGGIAGEETFANGTSSVYMEQMYEHYRRDPASVSPSWKAYFDNLEGEVAQPYMAPPTLGSNQMQQLMEMLSKPASQNIEGFRGVHEAHKLNLLLRSYMTHGHLLADIDPLRLRETYAEEEATLGVKYKFSPQSLTKLVDYRHYGFSEEDLDRSYYIDATELGGLLGKKKNWTLRELTQAYETAYCQKIGVEYMHIPDRERCTYIRDKFEGFQFLHVPPEKRVLNLERLLWADKFGEFLGTKFNTMKRFGLEGCESFIPGLKVTVDTLVERGVEKVVIGMPHRGRLNVLANVVRKPLKQIFSEFQGKVPDQEDEDYGSGDVKYHLGTSFTKTYPNGKKVDVTVLANPSHLEAVNPVAAGRCRAEQHFLRDEKRSKCCLILIHGDAAFAGQGVVYEHVQMSELEGYGVGGTIHVVVNNQIGFTTVPSGSRSGQYSSDLGKMNNAPIFHVNANSMDDVAKVFQFAGKYRQKYASDVFIDLVGYRQHGHNELDQPLFTQPQMYKIVKQMPTVAQIYEKQLLDEKVITEEKGEAIKQMINQYLQEGFEQSKNHTYDLEDWSSLEWDQLKVSYKHGPLKDTGIAAAHLRELGAQITALPSDMEFHPQVKKVYELRKKAIEEGVGIDWGCAESLAFASLINEGFHVRVSGQDVQRGTFSHRHAVLHHQSKDTSYTPLNSVKPDQEVKSFTIYNSHLSEYAVLGFEYGYSQTNPNKLTLWEAQFGDFANGAQIIIDQFIASGEAKWNVKNGLVMLLPHGFDGQGPEHSSCRVERYLQLCDDSEDYLEDGESREREVNLQVVNPTTAAQYFHVLRRQLRRHFRKPLVVVSPKKLLRFKNACSSIQDFEEGLRFQRVIPQKGMDNQKARKLIFCSGQVYYDLEAYKEANNHKDVAIARVEQLSPFPFTSIKQEMEKFPGAQVVWAQEEHRNQGPWNYARIRFDSIFEQLKRKGKVAYAGRGASASTATGYHKVHEQELKTLLQEAFH